MAYEQVFSYHLGDSQTGLSLESVIVNTVGVQVVGVTGSNTHLGSGWYLSRRTDIPDNHRGALVIRLSGGGAVKQVFAINPEEIEYSDIASSSIATEVGEVIETTVTDQLTELGSDWGTVPISRNLHNRFRFTTTDEAGDPTDLTTWTNLRLIVSYDRDGDDVAFTLTTAGGGGLTIRSDPNEHQVDAIITPTHLQDVPPAKILYGMLTGTVGGYEVQSHHGRFRVLGNPRG